MGKTDGRNHAIDIARGIAIAFMVIGHCYHEKIIITRLINSFHMPFFFIVTGVLYALKEKRGGKIDLKKNAKSLLIPYAVFEFMYSLFIISLSGQNFNDIIHELIKQLISTITFYGVSPTWFLPCLFFAECLFVLLKKTRFFQIPITLVLFFIGLLVPFPGYLIFVARSIVALGFITIGFYMFTAFSQLQKWYLFCIASIAFIVSASLNTVVSMVGSNYGIVPLFIASSLSGSYLLFQSSLFFSQKGIRAINMSLEFFGRNTIVILCTHMFFVEIIRAIDGKFTDNFLYKLGAFEGIVFAIIVMLLEVITIIICNRFFWFLFGKKKTNRG